MKYLLCRPNGGLNDVLCRVQQCWAYCQKYERILVVDTNVPVPECCFGYVFGDFFGLKEPDDNVKLELDDEMLATLQPLSTTSPHLRGRLHEYYKEKGRWPVQYKFNFDIDHEPDLLVLHAHGGGNHSVHALEKLVLQSDVAELVRDRLSALPKDYESIHVRNTDLTTDYETFFDTIVGAVANKNVLVCSDDVKCVAYAKAFFTDSNVFTLTDIPDMNGKSIHKHAPNKFKTNIDTMIDLLGLAMSSHIHFTGSLNNRGIHHVSGFTRLARNLQRRPNTIRDLIGRENGQTH